jgi:hypothetical protein
MDLGLDSLGMTMFCNRMCLRLDLKLSSSDLFDHPNVRSLTSFICDRTRLSPINPSNRRPIQREAVAVVSISCVFPGGCDCVEDFWTGLCNGRDFTSDAPKFWNSDTKNFRAGFLLDAQRCQFDPEYFGLSLTELQCMCDSFAFAIYVSLISQLIITGILISDCCFTQL